MPDSGKRGTLSLLCERIRIAFFGSDGSSFPGGTACLVVVTPQAGRVAMRIYLKFAITGIQLSLRC